MGVYIKGMEMPKDCWHCYFADPESGECLVDQKPHGDWEEPENCPLVPVPKHGRLIDEKDIVPKDGYIIADGMACIPVKDIVNAPTIIPAEEAIAEEAKVPAKPYDLLYEEGGLGIR